MTTTPQEPAPDQQPDVVPSGDPGTDPIDPEPGMPDPTEPGESPETSPVTGN